MKLLELLIQENVQWPEGALWAVQDGDKELKFTEADTPPTIPAYSPMCYRVWHRVWRRSDNSIFTTMYLCERASDWATKAVSKAEYDAAVAANAEWVSVKWGDWQVGDEIRFDGYINGVSGVNPYNFTYTKGRVYTVGVDDDGDIGPMPDGRCVTPAEDFGYKFSKRKPSASALAPAPVPSTVVTTPIRHWYKLLAPIITAAAEGKVVQYLAADGNWYDGSGAFIHPNKYRIKPEEPKTIKVNGFDVPEPMREAPAERTRYFLAHTSCDDYYLGFYWEDTLTDLRWLSHGLLHSTKEAAVAHAKAMLGIDPYATEDADDEHA